jgi:V/A-type H+-transporting ATPase subunit D
MAKIKHTKNELKHQRDALKRFQRYLPTLQLKKQQLQLEVRRLEAEIVSKEDEERKARDDLASWVKLFSEDVDLEAYLKLEAVELDEGNIAGVSIPLVESVRFDRSVPDLFHTPAWLDDGLDVLEQLLRLRVELLVLREQHRLVQEELRTTNQRVNLFEKVKIPEARENIRVIRIFLGDQQTAAVVRSKIAKGKSVEKVRSA